jgi:hypothetical protein
MLLAAWRRALQHEHRLGREK